MYFNATNKSSTNVSASGQNSTSGWINVTNAGNVVLNFYINITTSIPSGITVKTKTNNNPDGATTISNKTSLGSFIINNLQIGSSQSIWLWADYNNALPMNNQRTLWLNSSQ
jgi:hypothetical protein